MRLDFQEKFAFPSMKERELQIASTTYQLGL